MSTTITPRAGTFPEGTAVGLFKRTDVEVQRQQTLPPLAARVATGKISGGAFTTNTSLDPSTDYVLIGFVNEVQKVTVKAKKGKFKLTFEGQQTAGIKYNATATELKEALEALSNVAADSVSVSGGPGSESGSTPYSVTFLQEWAGTNVGAMTADVTELEETPKTVEISTATEGSQAGDGGVQRSCMYRTPAA